LDFGFFEAVVAAKASAVACSSEGGGGDPFKGTPSILDSFTSPSFGNSSVDDDGGGVDYLPPSVDLLGTLSVQAEKLKSLQLMLSSQQHKQTAAQQQSQGQPLTTANQPAPFLQQQQQQPPPLSFPIPPPPMPGVLAPMRRAPMTSSSIDQLHFPPPPSSAQHSEAFGVTSPHRATKQHTNQNSSLQDLNPFAPATTTRVAATGNNPSSAAAFSSPSPNPIASFPAATPVLLPNHAQSPANSFDLREFDPLKR
jgi:hypothetical protein